MATAVALLLVGASLGLAACGGGNTSATGGTATQEASETSGDEGSSGGGASTDTTLRIGVSSETLPNPAEATLKGYFASIPFSLAYAPLIHLAPSGKLEPALATSWHYIEGSGPRYTKFELTLRKGVKFSNGTPVTAAAVAKWLTYFGESTGPFKEVLGKSPKITASGDNVRIELTKGIPTLPTILSDNGPNIGFVMAPEAIENPKLLTKNTYGAGQYMLDSSRSIREDHYTYVPNPNYYEPSAIKFKEVEVKIIAEPAPRLQAQESGQLDVSFGDITTLEAAESAGLSVKYAPWGVQYLVLDTTHGGAPQLKDRRVREAMNLAIDRKSIAEALLGKVGTPASSFLLSDLETGMDEYWEYNPTKAKELLAEAGYEKGFTLKALTPGAYAGNLGAPLVRAVAKNLEEVGIKLEVTSFSTDPQYAEEVFSYKAPVFLLLQTLADTPTVYGSYVAAGSTLNFYGNDPQITKLYNEGLTSNDPTQAWKKMWQRFTTQAYVLPMVVNQTIYYVSESIGGVEVSKAHNAALPTEWYPQ